MQLLAILGLSALTSAVVIPRANEASPIALPIPYPLDEETARLITLPAPQEITYTAGDFVRKAGNVTEAPLQLPDAEFLASLQSRAIIGADDRKIQSSLTYPFVAMGRVRIATGSSATWCSGSLVGPRVVAFARHCVLSGASYSFSPAYHNGDRLPTAGAIAIVSLPNNGLNNICDYKDDWALLILDRGLQATSGYLGARNWETALDRQNVFNTYGYPQDLSSSGSVPYAQQGFPAWLPPDCSGNAPIFFTGDVTPGQSGSAVYRDIDGGAWQYGVVSAGTSTYNIWAHGAVFVNAIVAARNDFPA